MTRPPRMPWITLPRPPKRLGPARTHAADRIENERPAVDVARHAAQVGGVQQEADPRRERADHEAQGSNGGKIDASPSRGLGIATNGVHIPSEFCSLKNHHPGEEDSED